MLYVLLSFFFIFCICMITIVPTTSIYNIVCILPPFTTSTYTLFLFSVLCSCSYLYFNSPKLLLHLNLINKDAYFIFIYQYLKQPYISVDTPGICIFLFLKLSYLLELHFSCNCLSFFSFKFIV